MISRILKLNRIVRSIQREIWDSSSLPHLVSLAPPPLGWTKSALSPTAIRLITNDILINQRRNAIEFGSGLSTIYLGKALERNSGQLVSVEHDRDWFELVSMWVEEAGISETVKLIHSPLDHSNVPSWYGFEPIRTQLGDGPIDCVIVDGPPTHDPANATSRAPAADFVKERLSESFSVFLDDADRKAERQIAEGWARELGVQFTLDIGRSGLAYCLAGKYFFIGV